MTLSVAALVIAFLVGGFTLLPLALACFVGFIFYTSRVVDLPRKTGIPRADETPDDEAELVKLYRAGWLTVRRTYEPLLGPGEGTYVGALVSGYRSFMDNRSRDPRRIKPKDKFYGVLKQNVLFLYNNEEQVDCWAAIEVTAHDVLVYPEGCLDGELFVKRNAVCLRPKSVSCDSALAAHLATEETTHDMDADKPFPWFIFAKVNTDKEDWYHSLVEASKLGTATTTATLAKDRSMFDPDDMARLVEGIDQQPDSIPMRWLNALFGRIFLAVYRTESLEAYITSRIVRKLKRVKTPSILSEVQVREVNVGSAAPFFSKPMLKELTPDGDASMEVHLSYVGDLRITIETVATINLGSRFKPYSVRLVLAVVLKEIEGTLLFKIKKPPSNRVWFGFSTMPRMVLSVEPVVSTRQISWSMITSPIESRIREVILESIVVPHMDDFPFFNSSELFHRGGIWGDALRKEHDLSTPAGGQGDEATAIGHDEAIDDESLDQPSGTSTAREEGAEGSGARQRPQRRRRSSEGAIPTLSTTDAPPSSSSTSRNSPPSSIKGGLASSTSSLSGFSLASVASWRDTKPKDNSLGPGEKRKSWFAGRSGTGTGSTTPTSQSNPSFSRTSTSSTLETTSDVEQAPPQDLSATRLRDLLAKRAKEREKEKERERTPLEGLGEGFSPPTRSLSPSGLSLSAPPSGGAPESIPPPLDDEPKLDYNSDAVLASSVAPSSSPNAGVPDLLIEAPSPTKETAPIPLAFPDPSTSSPPPLPSRPSSTKLGSSLTTPPPLPRRPTHTSSVSVDTGTATPTSSTSTSSLLSSWRTKAADKQALAAGVAQAKDTMKRWGATWNARRESRGEGETDDVGETSSPPQDGGRILSSGWNDEGGRRSRSSSPSDRDGQRTPGGGYHDYRATKARNGNGNGDYFGATPSSSPGPSTPAIPTSTSSSSASSSSISAPVTIPPEDTRRRKDSVRRTDRRTSLSTSPKTSGSSGAGHFTPAAPLPTTKLSTQPTFAPGSPSAVPLPRKDSATTSSPGRTYKAAPMMAVPGLRDPTRRQAVASDHVSADEVPVAPLPPPTPSTTLPTTDLPKAAPLPPAESSAPTPTPTPKTTLDTPVIPDDPAVLISPIPTPLSETPPPPTHSSSPTPPNSSTPPLLLSEETTPPAASSTPAWLQQPTEPTTPSSITPESLTTSLESSLPILERQVDSVVPTTTQ